MQYGLIGGKLKHSYSKEIHESIADYCYELRELSVEELGIFLRSGAFLGINVTIPYKKTVIPYLDQLSPRAASIGAVNTVVNRSGKLYGFNTDFAGMLSLIRHAGITLSGKKVMILGTGGTAKTAEAVSMSLGAKEIVFISRRESPDTVTYKDTLKRCKDAEILINATPVGMWPEADIQPIELTDFPMLSGVIDVIYHPIRTNLLLEAEALEIPSAGGLYMLASQAAWSSALFTGLLDNEEDHAPETDRQILDMTEKAFRTVLLEKQNLVLIGMPGAGKSLAAERISEMTGRPFVNTDDLVEKRLGEPIPGFIRREGEAAFRLLEREAVDSVSDLTGHIIATGGGTVLDPKNVRALKRNGRLVLLKRDLDALTPAEDRPLSDTREKLMKLFEARRMVYEASKDVTAEGHEDPEETAKAVWRAFYGNEATL
ncbi:MAG: shikimate dehydrogenase [Lachnospiraceae bacterium]|nr:shikimate dehydrogenase [Lachnospiraceae bacterium]